MYVLYILCLHKMIHTFIQHACFAVNKNPAGRVGWFINLVVWVYFPLNVGVYYLFVDCVCRVGFR